IHKTNLTPKKRLNQLAQKLHEHGVWISEDPATPLGTKSEKKNGYSLPPYTIRAHAIRGKSNDPHELGRALLHMAKHRGAGFIDALEDIVKEDPTEEENKSRNKKTEKKHSSYELLPKYMKENGAATLGEYFDMRLRKEPGTGKIVR